MPTLQDITTKCRAGQLTEAYAQAKADYDTNPQNIWAQRGMGWVLYYTLKKNIEQKEHQEFYKHLSEISELNLLTPQSDALIFDNVVWKIAELIRNIVKERTDEIECIFSVLRKYTFAPSKGYSFLLKQILRFDAWRYLVEFFEWWNLDNLLPEDYQPFKKDNGQKIMSLAEQTYIAYAKALLNLNDKEKIQTFIPKIEKIIDEYPDMTYPGYFCGKLKLALGADQNSTLESILPFVRKKKTEFWVWVLLSECFKEEEDVQLACLLRAVHCRTQEAFLGKVRMKLVTAYIKKGDYPRAKCHLDQVTRCYMQQGWNLPFELQNWIREPWVNNTQADSSDGLNYKQYTDAILARGANTSIAVVTYVDFTKKRASLIFAEKSRVTVPFSKFGFKVTEGMLLELQWMPDANGSITIVNTKVTTPSALQGVTYIRKIEGTIFKRDNMPFAFVKKDKFQCYIKPELVREKQLTDKDKVSALVVLDYNKKKDSWDWNCLNLKKN